MFCRNCGQSVADSASSCPNCGQVVSSAASSPAPPPAKARAKKGHGCLVALLVVLVLLIGGGAAVYFLMPGLARPVDLGVDSSLQAYESTLRKLDFTQDEAPKSGGRANYQDVYGVVVPVDIKMSSEEVTSFFNYNRPVYYPLTNVQIKIGSESLRGTAGAGAYASLSASPLTAAADAPVEISATVDRDYVLNDLLAGQFSLEEVQKALKSIGITNLLPAKVNLYAKMSGSIQNNKVVDLKIYSASVMGVAIPSEYVASQDTSNIVTSIFNQLLADYSVSSGAILVSVRAAGGQILLAGQLPSSLTRSPIG